MVDRDSIELMITSAVAAGAVPVGPPRLGGGMYGVHMIWQHKAALAVLVVLVVGVVILVAT
jgi:hypothetical protein